MIGQSLMQRIFEGTFPKDLFDSFAPFPHSEKADRVIEGYRQLLQEFPPETLEAEGRLPPEMLQGMAGIGLFGFSIPVAYGGLGFDTREYMRVVEGMVRLDMAAALASLAHLAIGVKGIELFGNEAQKQKYLIPAATGKMIFSYALTEPRIGSDARHIETRAERSPDGQHYLLTGQKTYITNANYAGGLTVFAQMDPARPGFMGAFIVETGWTGVKIGRDMPKMGLKASSTAAMQFREVAVPAENLLGKPGDGFKIAMTILNYGRLALGAASLGHDASVAGRYAEAVVITGPVWRPHKEFSFNPGKTRKGRSHVASSVRPLTISRLPCCSGRRRATWPQKHLIANCSAPPAPGRPSTRPSKWREAPPIWPQTHTKNACGTFESPPYLKAPRKSTRFIPLFPHCGLCANTPGDEGKEEFRHPFLLDEPGRRKSMAVAV